MINFYRFYTRNDLDNQHYAPLLVELKSFDYTVKRLPLEHIIKRIPKYAYLYSYYVIKGRWPEAEPYIMKDAKYASWYAKDVIKGSWPEAEDIIQQYEYRWTLRGVL